MALTGVIENFSGLCVAVMISGVGIAMLSRAINQSGVDG